MLDQNNNPIPDDLVLLNDVKISEITTKQWKELDDLNWYCFACKPKPHIFVSFEMAAIANPDFASLLCDASGPDDIAPLHDLLLIDSVLHRSNLFDGWYSA